MKDKIQKVVDLPVDINRAWQAISTPEGLSSWFCDQAGFDLNIGAGMIFDWIEYGKKFGQVAIMDPPYRFGFRWLAGDGASKMPVLEDNSTLVEMVLVEITGGTRLTVTESGFANLPPHLQKTELQKNDRGWDVELGELHQYLTGVER